MKNTIKTILCICLAAMTAVSCENVLDKATISGRNTTNFPATEEELAQMVNSIYVTLTESVSEYPTSNYFVYANIASDDQLGGGGDSDIDIQAMDRLMYSDPDFFAGYWNKLYEGIRRANAAINSAETIDMSEQRRNELVGEARILRAYFYFTLAQMFEDVPIVETSNATEPYPSLLGVDELYRFILTDLCSAYNTMTYENNPGRVTKATAAGLLARVYMFYLGLYKNESLIPLAVYNPEEITLREVPGAPTTIKKADVVACLENVISDGRFQLVPDFRLLWPYTNSEIMKDYPYVQDLSGGGDAFEMNNPEIIFQICFSPRHGQSNTMFQYFGLRQGYFGADESFFPFNKGYGVAPVCTIIWEEWFDEDPRKVASICSIMDELEFGGDWGGCNDGLESTAYLQKKFQTCSSKDGEGLLKFREALSSNKYCGDGKTDLGLGNSPANLTVMRYSDILLMHSELTGDATHLNKVQKRAGIRETPYTFTDIQNERRYEFAFEGLRWGDLRRWSGINAAGTSYCAKALEKQRGSQILHRNEWTTMYHPSSYAQRYAETKGFLDYPESVIQESDGLLQHKEGWDAYSAQFTRWQ
ncbi:MAG: RagB/SusD family nutrient uptake outer membrane protein [Bacteroidales bacterium]|nr:RagB/SusD family nutrient uptake outer membrane protein [Bacteroidales bacterium]